MSRLHDPARRIVVLSSDCVVSVIESWAQHVSASIIDIECTNNVVKHFYTSGRPEKFSKSAAKGMIHEAVRAFELKWGRPPTSHLKRAHNAVAAMVATDSRGSKQRRGPQRGTQPAPKHSVVAAPPAMRSLDTNH